MNAAGKTSAPGRADRMSSAVHSGFSRSGTPYFLVIVLSFRSTCAAHADDPGDSPAHREDSRDELVVHGRQNLPLRLAANRLRRLNRLVLPIEVFRDRKRHTVFRVIDRILRSVEFKKHKQIVYTILGPCPSLRRPPLVEIASG